MLFLSYSIDIPNINNDEFCRLPCMYKLIIAEIVDWFLVIGDSYLDSSSTLAMRSSLTMLRAFLEEKGDVN